MTGFDFAPWTFAVGVVSLILIALNSKRMRHFSFISIVRSLPQQMIDKLPVGITIETKNSSENFIKSLYLKGSIAIGDKTIELNTVQLTLDASPRYTFFNYKPGLKAFGLISDPPMKDEIEQILQKGIKVSIQYSYYRFHIMSWKFLKREKTDTMIWDQEMKLWMIHPRPNDKIT